MPSLLGLSGSLRAGSLNTKLVQEAARLFEPSSFVMGDLRLPLYDGDLEAKGIPEAVQTLADQISAADAVVVATPEYNKNISGVLKNALDWVSRVEGKPWADKPVAILSATAGRSGGERAQWSLRLCLQPFRPRLLSGPETLVGSAKEQFDDQGQLTNKRNHQALTDLMSALKAEIGR